MSPKTNLVISKDVREERFDDLVRDLGILAHLLESLMLFFCHSLPQFDVIHVFVRKIFSTKLKNSILLEKKLHSNLSAALLHVTGQKGKPICQVSNSQGFQTTHSACSTVFRLS